MKYQNLLIFREEGVGVITINHPPTNALNAQTLEELGSVFEEMEKDEEIKAVIITGSGERVFASGADINEFKDLDKETALKMVNQGKRVFNQIETFPKPIIAAINGACLGGGCELAMCCDLRVAVEGARFGQPEIRLGIMPGWGGTQRLPRLVGKTRALELLLSGNMIKADEAKEIGLINKTVPSDKLISQAKLIAHRLVKLAPLAIKEIKRAVNEGLNTGLFEGLKLEGDCFLKVLETEDAKIGISAFLSKKSPRFKGK